MKKVIITATGVKVRGPWRPLRAPAKRVVLVCEPSGLVRWVRVAAAWLLLCGAAWGGTFTDPLTTHAQDLDLINELVNAWSQRWDVVGTPVVSLVTTNDTFQDVYMASNKPWEVMQYWVMNNCDKFVRHSLPTNDPGNYHGFTNGIPMYGSITDVFLDAGCTYSNFRRARVWEPPNPPVWTNGGPAEVDDIAQVWIWQDVQTAFSMLRYTKRSTTDWTGGRTVPEKLAGPYVDDTWARNAVLAAWTGAWTNHYSAAMGKVYADCWGYVRESGGSWYAGAKRFTALPTVSGVATSVAAAVDIYYLPADQGGNTTWDDFDDLGFVPGELFFNESQPAAQDATRTATNYVVPDAKTDCPLLYVATNSPPPDPNDIGYWIGDSIFVFKWDFT
ncbi:MAG: hypothetical protein FJ276_21810, partial [Planctomycetes bacterium]|nr:hypothetical protein [Planctomycetota bacterium]